MTYNLERREYNVTVAFMVHNSTAWWWPLLVSVSGIGSLPRRVPFSCPFEWWAARRLGLQGQGVHFLHVVNGRTTGTRLTGSNVSPFHGLQKKDRRHPQQDLKQTNTKKYYSSVNFKIHNQPLMLAGCMCGEKRINKDVSSFPLKKRGVANFSKCAKRNQQLIFAWRFIGSEMDRYSKIHHTRRCNE